MYFKYYPMESKELAIREVDFVRVVELAEASGGGYLLVPYSDERKSAMIDAAIQRLAALTCEPREVMEKVNLFCHKGFSAVAAVWNHMEFDDPWYDGLKWYETLADANAEVEKIAEAIAQGDRLYDLTGEGEWHR